MSLSPVSVLAASLRALSARAAEHSSPIALSQVLAEGFAAIATAIEQGVAAADALVASIDELPLTPGDRAALERAGMVAVASASGPALASIDTGVDQVVEISATAAGPGSVLGACILQHAVGMTPQHFDDTVAEARATLFGLVAA